MGLKSALCASLVGLAAARELPTESGGIAGSLRKLLGGKDTINLLKTSTQTANTAAVDIEAVAKSFKKNWRKVAGTFYDYDEYFTGGSGDGYDEYDYDGDGGYDTIVDGGSDTWDLGNMLYVCVYTGGSCANAFVGAGWVGPLTYKNSATKTNRADYDGEYGYGDIDYVTIKRKKIFFTGVSSDDCNIRGFNTDGGRGDSADYTDYWDAPMMTKFGMYTVFMSQEADASTYGIHRLIIAPSKGAKGWVHYVDYTSIADYDKEYAMSVDSGDRVCNLFYLMILSEMEHMFSATDLRVIAGNFIYFVLDMSA